MGTEQRIYGALELLEEAQHCWEPRGRIRHPVIIRLMTEWKMPVIRLIKTLFSIQETDLRQIDGWRLSENIK